MLLPHRSVLLAGSGPSPGRPPAGLTTGRHWPGFCLRAHSAAPDWTRKSRVSAARRRRRRRRRAKIETAYLLQLLGRGQQRQPLQFEVELPRGGFLQVEPLRRWEGSSQLAASPGKANESHLA